MILKPINPDNILDMDSKFKYYFPKLWKIKSGMKMDCFERYEKYINECKSMKYFNRTKTKAKNKIPFLSVSICTHNSIEYIERAILSILNQSFQNFEIIIIDDFSNDGSDNFFKKYLNIDDRFRIINHEKNFGIYRSRVDAIYYSKGEYILFVDADDMILNEYLFELLFSYATIYHLDIIISFSILRKKKLNCIIKSL